MKTDKILTVAICTYNRAVRLSRLVKAIRKQECQIPFEIFVVDNNSTDNTRIVLQNLAMSEGIPLRFVKEKRQGIVHARNRAIDEALGSSYIAFIDDDEIPCNGWLKAAVDALAKENADCVGGEIRVSIPFQEHPKWMENELLGFLGEVKYATKPFWIVDNSTPLWSGNIAYRMSLFADGIRFDERYNREGTRVGGSEDAEMFRVLLERGVRMRYRPDMIIEHYVDADKIKRSYFLKLHHAAGRRRGRWDATEFSKTCFGVPPFVVVQLMKQCGRVCMLFVKGERGLMRQIMNVTYDLGIIRERFLIWKSRGKSLSNDSHGKGYAGK